MTSIEGRGRYSNAVLLTTLVANDYFGDRAVHVTPMRLSIISGLANLLLTPFGAMPMCHGAGGLAAYYRFDAPSGTAPLVLGLVLLAVALLPAKLGLATLATIPTAGWSAAADGFRRVALPRRLFDCKPSCWPVIAVTAGVTVWGDPFSPAPVRNSYVSLPFAGARPGSDARVGRNQVYKAIRPRGDGGQETSGKLVRRDRRHWRPADLHMIKAVRLPSRKQY